MKSKHLLLMLLLALLAPWAANAQSVQYPTWSSSTSSYIKEFKVMCGTTTLLDNVTTGTAAQATDYYDDGSVVINAQAGDELTCTISTYSSGTHGFGLWADLNGDGLDATDLISGTTTYASTPRTITFTIPGNTPAGEYRLRIVAAYYTGSCSDPNGSYSAGESEDYKLVVTVPACPKPALSNIVATTNGEATITWTPANASQTLFDIYWSTFNTAPTSETTPGAANQNGTSYTITGLEASTDYYVWIRGNCGTDGLSGWTSAVSFKTKCDPTDLPYGVIDFNDLSNYAMPDCWTMVAGLANGTSSGSGAYSSSSPRGAKHFRFGYGATNNVVTLAPLSVEANTTQIEFYAKSGSSSYNALEVGYLTNSADASTFVAIRTLNASEYTSYPASAIKVPMTSAPNGATIAFRFQTTGNYTCWYVDDVTIGEAPSCVAVTPGATTDITSTGAILHWTTTNAATTTYTITDGDAIDVTTAAGATSHPLTGLTPGTTYSTLTITANCGGSDHSDPVNVPSFSTAYGIPFAESFGTSLPSNWKMYTGQYNESTHTATLASGSPWNFGEKNGVFDNHARANIFSTGCYKWLVTPGIVMEDNVQITFDLALTKYDGSNQQVAQDNQADDKFIVLVTTDNGETWTVLRKWDNAGSSYVYNSIAYSATGQTEAIDLSAYAGETVKIAFYGESTVTGGDNNIHIDNVNIDYIPNCAKPTGLAKANVAAHTVDLSWTENGTATAWQICINDDMDHLVDATTNPYTLTSLVSETEYTVKVRANCGGSNGVSQWSNVVSFTTTVACPAPTSPSVLNSSITAHTAKFTWIGSNATPDYVVSYRTAAYTEGFEEEFNTNSIPTGWTRYSGLVDQVIAGTATLTSGTSWTTTSYALGSYNAKLNIFGENCKHWLVTPEISIESGYSFSFDLALTGYNSSSAASGSCADDRFVVLIYADDAWTILREWNNSGSTYVYNDIATDGESVNDIDISGYVGKTVKFAFYGESTASGGDNDLHIDNVAVGIAHDAGTWQTVDVDDSGDDTPAAEKTLTGLVAEKKYDVKVKANCTASSDGYSLETSIVTFTTDIACKKPTTLAADATGATTVTLSWTNGEEGQNAWQICINGDEEHLVAANANPFTVEGLTPATTYSFKVRANCTAADDGYSDWSNLLENVETQAACPTPVLAANGITNITDNSATVTWTGFAENQDFIVSYRTAAYMDGIEEGFDPNPTTWEVKTGLLSAVMGGTALAAATFPQWGYGDYNGVFDKHAALNIYGTSCKSWLITPAIDVEDGFALRFDLALTDYDGSLQAPDNDDDDDRFVVLVSTDNKATWSILREWNNTGSPYEYSNIPYTAVGENININLDGYAGQTVHIAFYGESTESGDDNRIHIDNVVCGLPVAAGAWQTVSPNPTTTTTTITGLTPETKYDVKVQANCALSQTSEESEVRSFTTYYGATLDVTANSWYAISAPVHNSGNNETVVGVDNLIATDPVKYDFLRYNEQYAKWESQKDDGFDAMERGRGYIYRRSAATTLKFIGERNTGNITYFCQGVSSGTMKGWNLIGNPYPHAITRAHISQASDYLVSGYYTLQASGSWRAEASTTAPIAVGQAILVKVTYGGNVTFSETAPATKSAPASTIAFTVSNDEFTDIAYARFSSEEGLPKISHLNPEAPMLSIDGYAIANLNEGTESFPMSFSGQGSYTLTVSGNTDITGYLHLVDRLTGRDIDLLSTPSYSFTGSPVSDRFTVKLRPDANEGSSTSRFAIFDGNSLVISGEGTLEVYDVMGRRLMSAEVTGSEYRIPGSDLHTGVYVLRMNGNSQKIVIK